MVTAAEARGWRQLCQGHKGPPTQAPGTLGVPVPPKASLPHVETASRAPPAERLSFQQISPDNGQATSMSCEHSGRTTADRAGGLLAAWPEGTFPGSTAKRHCWWLQQ